MLNRERVGGQRRYIDVDYIDKDNNRYIADADIDINQSIRYTDMDIDR